MKKHKYLLIIIVLFIFYNSFFINKAFHIDDGFILFFASRINADFFTGTGQDFSNNPPLLMYYYAPIVKALIMREPVAHIKEFWMHLFYFPFSILVILSMYFLSLRFAKKSLFPLLFLIATPAFIISSQSIMFDIPLLGFFLAAAASFIYGIDKDKNRLLVLSGLFASAAILTKYSGLMLIPILLIYALLTSHKEKIKFLLIPVSIFLLWNACCLFFYKEATFFTAFFDRSKDYFLNKIGIRTLASLSFLSGTSIVILLLVPFLWQKRKNLPYIFLSLASGICPFIINNIFAKYSLLEKLFLAVLFIASSYVILLIFQAGFRSLFNKDSKDTLFLSAWFFLIFAFNILTNFIAARFILLLLPPFFLFIFNELPYHNSQIVKLKLSFIVFITVVFSTLLAIGDYQFAGLYRDFVYSFKQRVSVKEKENVYFYRGSIAFYQSWGYTYYLWFLLYESTALPSIINYRIKERLGWEDSIFVTPTEPVLPCVIEEKAAFDKFLDSNYNKILLDTIYYNGNIVLHNRKFNAGFYSHDWGLLPFYLSIQKVPLEVFKIYRLSYLPKDDF